MATPLQPIPSIALCTTKLTLPTQSILSNLSTQLTALPTQFILSTTLPNPMSWLMANLT
jgi:hypothetical protein